MRSYLSDSPHLAEAAQDIHWKLDPGPDLHVRDDLRSGKGVDTQVLERRFRRDLIRGNSADSDDRIAQRNVEIHHAVPLWTEAPQ
jgi:hypothetical protein